jgi:hypothetical protein
LGLVAKDQWPLFVVQVMEPNRRPDAVYSVDWTDLFNEGDPRERRRFRDPEDARPRIAADPAMAQQRLRGAGIHDFEVVGPMRLPLASAVPDIYHLQAGLPEPGRPALDSLAHAQAVIFQLREELRSLRRSLRPPEVHLFLAMPGACALLLGNAWDRTPPTWTYWDLGAPGRYEKAVLVSN